MTTLDTTEKSTVIQIAERAAKISGVSRSQAYMMLLSMGVGKVTYTADDLSTERILEIRRLASEQKVDAMLVQEWEVVALCNLSLRSKGDTILACDTCIPPQELKQKDGEMFCPKCLKRWPQA